jgi:hypothetical protein
MPAENLTAMDGAATTYSTNCDVLPILDPVLVKRLARMGNKTESFSRRAIALGKENIDLLPKGLSLVQAEAALANRDVLLTRWLKMKQITDRLEMAMILCGVDAYNAARSAYRSMKVNTRDAALHALLRDLARTFQRETSDDLDPIEPPAEGGGESTGDTSGSTGAA